MALERYVPPNLYSLILLLFESKLSDAAVGALRNTAVQCCFYCCCVPPPTTSLCSNKFLFCHRSLLLCNRFLLPLMHTLSLAFLLPCYSLVRSSSVSREKTEGEWLVLLYTLSCWDYISPIKKFFVHYLLIMTE